MNHWYPERAAENVRVESVILQEKNLMLQERLSSRMVKCASVMGTEDVIGWQMYVPVQGEAVLSVFGSEGYCASDLAWIAEKEAKITGKKGRDRERGRLDGLKELWEICIPAAKGSGQGMRIGFCAQPEKTAPDSGRWPLKFPEQFSELTAALRESGAMLRVALSAADPQEQENCRKNVLQTLPLGNGDAKEYIGTPVRIRALLRLPASPSVRLRTVIEAAVPGSSFRRIGSMQQDENAAVWQDPVREAPVLPDYAARILVMEPVLYETVIGIRTAEAELKPLPASHKAAVKKKAVTIGKAVSLAGTQMKIAIAEEDLRRHYQIVGQTGTGKSTLLINLILNAIRQGYGLTFFDPHGNTIDRILRSVPPEYARRIRVVRIGDAQHPVPLGIWDSDDPEKEERTISDLCELFSDIFDPDREGFVGPRYERWLSVFAKASIAMLGRRASLESITVLSQNKKNMRKLYEAIRDDYPELAGIIEDEYGRDNSSDFQGMVNWFLCKFQRLTGCEQLRATLGGGTNALDFANTIDTDTVTLIDLASPVIGTHEARVVGTLLMMKLWNAVLGRKEREKTHLVVVDEASLFQTNPLPRMLAEGRKFGISMVLCHQHSGQLTRDVRDALESNTANFTAFRLSTRDAADAALRFDDPQLRTGLARLDAFRAVTTISEHGQQTAPFTLRVTIPSVRRDGEETAARIEEESIRTLVEPYKDLKALTRKQIQEYLDHPELLKASEKQNKEDEERAFSELGSLLDELGVGSFAYDLDEEYEENPADMPIEELHLSIRSYNSLKRVGIHTLGALADIDDLSGIRNLGKRNVEEITEKVLEYLQPDEVRFLETKQNENSPLSA